MRPSLTLNKVGVKSMTSPTNPLGIMSYTYMNHSAEEMADAIAAHGLKYVQIDPRQPGILGNDLSNFSRAEDIRSVFANRGISIIALSSYFINFYDPDPEVKEHNIQTVEQIIVLSQAFGAQYVATETGSMHPTNHWRYHPDNASERSFSSLAHVVERLRQKAIRSNCAVLLEGFVNHVMGDIERAERLVTELGDEGLGFVLDPFNYMTPDDLNNQSESLTNIFGRIGSLSRIAHAKDATYTEEGFKTPRAGTGDMNWTLVAKHFKRYAPDIPLLLEHLGPDEVEECIAFIQKQFHEAHSFDFRGEKCENSNTAR